MRAPRPTVSMIVAENGALWSPWVQRLSEDAADVVVVLQQVGESLMELAARVRARVSELEQDGLSVEQAVLVGGGRTDRDAVSFRSLAIRSMASGMARQGGGRVLLEDAGADRYSMAAIAVTVADLVAGSGVSVEHAPAVQLARVA